MRQINRKMVYKEVKRIAVLLAFIFLIYALLYGWIMWRQYKYISELIRYKQEFTQEELNILQAELQINLEPGYTVYNAMYNSESLYVEIYTEEDFEEIWRDLFGIETGKICFAKESKWETLNEEIVEGMIMYPCTYDQNISTYISSFIWEKDNGYCVSIYKRHFFQYKEDIKEMFKQSDGKN